MSHSVHNKLPK